MTKSSSPFETIDRLYVLNAGIAIAPDRSVYSPGKTEKGKPISLCCHAYLIHRKGKWILWDTGIEDALFEESGGKVIAHNIRGIVVRTIREQLAEIGLQPEDVGTVLLSHGHFDHIGNATMFPHATWYLQSREYDAMFGPDFQKHGYTPALYHVLKQAKVEQIEGDVDLFQDGSVKVIFTPGHTPGHCSLLVHLSNSGPILLSGDVAHFQFNLENRCVPTMNSSVEESLHSMDRVATLVQEENAKLWINHDFTQTATILHAPAFYD
ncbi:N-acyl homoserine lactonase [Planctomycetales bacterium 10988]|nr:N-acyl homoserine lactonase [Planctomycetales bacterium 10988]